MVKTILLAAGSCIITLLITIPALAVFGTYTGTMTSPNQEVSSGVRTFSIQGTFHDYSGIAYGEYSVDGTNFAPFGTFTSAPPLNNTQMLNMPVGSAPVYVRVRQVGRYKGASKKGTGTYRYNAR